MSLEGNRESSIDRIDQKTKNWSYQDWIPVVLVHSLDGPGPEPEQTVEVGPLTYFYCVFRQNVDFFTFFFSNFVFDRMHNDNIFNLLGLGFLAFDFFSKFIQSGRLKINVSLRNKNKICVYLDTYDHMDSALSIHTVWFILELSKP